MTTKPTIFIVDDDPSIRLALENLISSTGQHPETYESAQDFLRDCPRDPAGCLVLDVQMPGLSGLDLQGALTDAGIHLPVIFITGHGDIPTTVRAMKAGAAEFLDLRVIRGGSWQSDRTSATTTYRWGWQASGGKDYSNTGFRCVKDAQ